MFSLADPRYSNPILSELQIKPEDQIISIRENANADSNFIITHLIKQFLYEKHKLCLVTFHSNVAHYQSVGKKLGYDLLSAKKNNEVIIIDPINAMVEDVGKESGYLREDKDSLLKSLYLDIKKHLNTLLGNGDHQANLIIDDLSHLVDLGVDVCQMINFTTYCLNLTNNDKISVVLNNHVGNKIDEIVSNNLQYIANVHIEVSALKTGASLDVTGSFTVEKDSRKRVFHYKAYDRGIKTFHPGESIYHLYK
ncbi:unnamed protein product [Acanthoscelides obtectus]|uniref:Elongator complex protein 6 n=1 Tax=Acanthoscelides obtectus TaxID=200917 RepID=A0A9P0JRT3_ACAOB|nr:unnamed protein product [Acanthoscelides obtectus]CAK1662167.1 Elongator complex protein 6 [Acanthoscelides obtectus]